MFAYKLQGEYRQFIIEIVYLMDCRVYLELGCGRGYNIHAITPYCPRCIGVDILDIRRPRNFEFYKESTDDFFKWWNVDTDIIFIDANHDFEYCKRDFINSLRVLSKYGIIFIHDTDPTEKEFLFRDVCGDSYKIIDWIRVNYDNLSVFNLPIGCAGLTMVQRTEDRRVYNFI